MLVLALVGLSLWGVLVLLTGVVLLVLGVLVTGMELSVCVAVEVAISVLGFGL